MRRETAFQKNVKYVIYMTAIVCALCQFILLFSEFNYLSGLGIVINMIYHISGVACPVFILYLFYSENKDKDVYGSYAIGGEILLSACVSIAILVKYINKTNDTYAYATSIVVFLIISIVIELLVSFLFFRYGMDKITCVLPVLTLFISTILRDTVISNVDSKLHIKVNVGLDDLGNITGTSFKGSFMSAWTFLHAFFFLIFVIGVVLYVDMRFLEDLKDNPKSLFTKETLFGTFTNGLIKEEKPKKKNGNTAQQAANTYSQQVVVSTPTVNDSKYIDSGNVASVSSHQKYESNTDKSLQSDASSQGKVAVDHTESLSENINLQNTNAAPREGSFRKCPDCGSIVPEGKEMCMTCGCPIEETKLVVYGLVKPVKTEVKSKITGGSVRKCPDCGSVVPEGKEMCMTCGCPME